MVGRAARPLLDAGVAGIWNDMNEPAGWKRELRVGRLILPLQAQDSRDVVQADPARAEAPRAPRDACATSTGISSAARRTRRCCERARPSGAPFVLSRSGHAGIQRYAALWTGDTTSRWPQLALSVRDAARPVALGRRRSAAPTSAASPAGAAPELFARWMQIGALYPFARTHSMWLKRRQEPWRFGKRVEAIARAALELRMRLLPYLVWALPRGRGDRRADLATALLDEFPDDPRAAAIEDQVMLGRDLLVAPVLERGATRARGLSAGRRLDRARRRRALHRTAHGARRRAARAHADLRARRLRAADAQRRCATSARSPRSRSCSRSIPGGDAATRRDRGRRRVARVSRRRRGAHAGAAAQPRRGPAATRDRRARRRVRDRRAHRSRGGARVPAAELGVGRRGAPARRGSHGRRARRRVALGGRRPPRALDRRWAPPAPSR